MVQDDPETSVGGLRADSAQVTLCVLVPKNKIPRPEWIIKEHVPSEKGFKSGPLCAELHRAQTFCLLEGRWLMAASQKILVNFHMHAYLMPGSEKQNVPARGRRGEGGW